MKSKVKAPKNRTLTLSDAEEHIYQERLIIQDEITDFSLEEILNKTICADLFQVIDFLPNQFADLIILDPPYNLAKNFNGFKFHSSDNLSYYNYLLIWFPKVIKKLKPNGSVYLCGDWKCTSSLQQIMDEYLTILNRITWQREKGRGAKNNWKNCIEDIWFGVNNHNDYYFDVESVKVKRKVIAPYKVNGQPKDWEQTENGRFRLTHPSNFWDDITIPFWSMPENTDHPTQKPEKLIAKLILASCPENGVVFDPFLGSGTTSVVAKKLGRNYCGIELNKEYACIAEKRLERVNQDTSIQGFKDGVFWERNTFSFQNNR